jgi:hypothetical protein
MGQTILSVIGGAMLSCIVCLIVGVVAGVLLSAWKQHSDCKFCSMEEKCEDFY